MLISLPYSHHLTSPQYLHLHPDLPWTCPIAARFLSSPLLAYLRTSAQYASFAKVAVLTSVQECEDHKRLHGVEASDKRPRLCGLIRSGMRGKVPAGEGVHVCLRNMHAFLCLLCGCMYTCFHTLYARLRLKCSHARRNVRAA